jgi:predicted nucleic-acid-binding protein
MIGLDTNVLVRHIMQDDLNQAALASTLISQLTEQNPGFVTVVTLIELSWVLQSCFDLSRAQLADVLDKIVRASNFKVEQAQVVAAAIKLYNFGNSDFADCLIARISQNAGCQKIMTFDRNAAKTAGMVLIS